MAGDVTCTGVVATDLDDRLRELMGEHRVPGATLEYPLSPVEPGVYAMRAPGTTTWLAVTFYALDDGSRYVHYGARANPLVGT